MEFNTLERTPQNKNYIQFLASLHNIFELVVDSLIAFQKFKFSNLIEYINAYLWEILNMPNSLYKLSNNNFHFYLQNFFNFQNLPN